MLLLLLTLAQALVLPINSCDVERLFSLMKQIKTMLASMMAERNLDVKMEIAANLKERETDVGAGASRSRVRSAKLADRAHNRERNAEISRRALQVWAGFSDRRAALPFTSVDVDKAEFYAQIKWGSSFLDGDGDKAAVAAELLRKSRIANRAKRMLVTDSRSVPPTAGSRLHLLLQANKDCFEDRGDMTRTVGDRIGHWFDDRGGEVGAAGTGHRGASNDVGAGWSFGRIVSLNLEKTGANNRRAVRSCNVLYQVHCVRRRRRRRDLPCSCPWKFRSFKFA